MKNHFPFRLNWTYVGSVPALQQCWDLSRSLGPCKLVLEFTVQINVKFCELWNAAESMGVVSSSEPEVCMGWLSPCQLSTYLWQNSSGMSPAGLVPLWQSVLSYGTKFSSSCSLALGVSKCVSVRLTPETPEEAAIGEPGELPLAALLQSHSCTRALDLGLCFSLPNCSPPSDLVISFFSLRCLSVPCCCLFLPLAFWALLPVLFSVPHSPVCSPVWSGWLLLYCFVLYFFCRGNPLSPLSVMLIPHQQIAKGENPTTAPAGLHTAGL